MGLRASIAAWLHAPATTPAGVRSPLERDLIQRIEKLELDRPAFVTALEEIAERCHDILDTSEAKRARVAARESKLKKREERHEEGQEQPELPPDRDAIKANVRAILRARGYLH
jgi:hypothetical protein